jgi:hypothetical protein
MSNLGITGAIKEGLSLWSKYLETKVERYEVHLKKRRQKALDTAEEAFSEVREMVAWVEDNFKMTHKQKNDFNKIKNKYYKYKDKFEHLD